MRRCSLFTFLLLLSGFVLVSCSIRSRLEGSWTSVDSERFSTLLFNGERFSLTYYAGSNRETAEGKYSIKESSFSDDRTSMPIVFSVDSSTKFKPDDTSDTNFLAMGDHSLFCILKNSNTYLIIEPAGGGKGRALCRSYEK